MSIAAFGHGFDEPWFLSVILQHGPSLPDGVVHTLLKIDECIRAPHFGNKILTIHDLARTLDKNCQHLCRLRLELQRYSVCRNSPLRQSNSSQQSDLVGKISIP